MAANGNARWSLGARAWVVAVLVLSVGAAFAVARVAAGPSWMWDLDVYRTAGAALWRGASPYQGPPLHQFTYPPFAALLLSPLALLPEPLVGLAVSALLALLVAVVLRRCLRWVGVADPGRRRASSLVGALALMPFDPVFKNLVLGQINLVVLVAVLADLALPDRSRRKGALTGLVAGLKLEPLVFVAYLLVTRRFRAAGTALGVFLATVLAGFLVLPGDSARYWGGWLWDFHRVGSPSNVWTQSLLSVLVRWTGTEAVRPLWLVLAGVVGGVGLVVAVRAHRRGDEFAAVGAVALIPLLVTPIAWNHHYVLALPALVLLAQRAHARRSGPLAVLAVLVAACFYLAPYTFVVPGSGVPDHLRLTLVGQLLASAYLVAVVALLAGVAVATRVPTPRTTADVAG